MSGYFSGRSIFLVRVRRVGKKYVRNNRPFPSSLVPLFQSESKCETILVKMTDLRENETACRTHFHMKGFALRLVLKQRHKRTRKWPI